MHSDPPSTKKDVAWLRGGLDRCVKCGLCLAECPTYRLSLDENASPRGRLAIMEALVSGTVDAADERALANLDTCLGCRRCERVCPSGVEYGALLDATRARGPAQPMRRLLARMLQSSRLQRSACALSRVAPLALSSPFGRIGALHRMGRALKQSGSAPAAQLYPGRPPSRGRVGLFAGCSAAAMQPDVLQAAKLLLRHAGFDVLVAAKAHCCGALAAHAGDTQSADQMARRSRAAFDVQLDAVISLASGCGAHLEGYEPPLPHVDICRFLAEQDSIRSAGYRALPDTVALHVPCSVENVYRGGIWARTLLGLVPGCEPVVVGTPGGCCGAAGDYMLRHPSMADRLRQPVLDDIIATNARILATSNIGCAVHLALGLADRGSQVRVMHPVEIVAKQLIPAADNATA